MTGRRTRRHIALAGALVAVLVAAKLIVDSFPGSAKPRGGTVAKPIDPRHLTRLGFGERSHWLQPWRAYLDTPPATRLRDAIAINFNVEPAEADATARMLAASGFRRARVEFGWDSLDFRGRLARRGRVRGMLGALRRHGIRPLILLNANHGAPGPVRRFRLRLTAPAPAGARRVRLDAGGARRVRPGLTGLDDPEGKAAAVIFTRVGPGGAATLSKPLPRALPAGEHAATTLRHPPFGPPRLAGGRPNPRFEETLAGWLGYVRTVVGEARGVLGGEGFDVEIWNELSFGSDFLFQERYYDPPRETGEGDVTRAILEASVSAVRALSGRVGIADGFASQTPFPAGSTSPRGLTALSKHPYYGIKRFPRSQVADEIVPLDARGRPDFERARGPGGKVVRRDRFVPAYDAFFPEYILSGIQTETLIRDLAPITTEVNGVAHGRRTRPPGGRPPEVWVTETNLDPSGVDPSVPGRAGAPVEGLGPRDVERMQAKAALRYYVSFVNKGAGAVHLYAVKGHNLALVDPRFFTALERDGRYPGARAGGLTPRVVGRLSRALRSAGPVPQPRPLSLRAVSDDHGHTQFEGDGTPARPPLFDREVVAFLPFQLGRGRYVAAAYVMTRSLVERRRDDLPDSDPARLDLAPAPFRITVGGLGTGRVEASATDPLTGESVRVGVTRRAGGAVELELPLTDSPRLVSLRVR